jgi:prevent-host-death family protein
MVIVNIHKAKSTLSRLIEQAEAGEEVVIARNGKPVVKLAPLEPVEDEARRPDGLPAWMGTYAGRLWVAPNFDAYDPEIASLFEDGEVLPREEPEG